ncbi:hypothetical protein STRTUCAR8_00476 [Streptomyces turgidiscabies Car8]|uniref:Uncharacterized protein n=1 Tax=Streptomyces turgidiscabies (strain Car8) TaxID=698760 RepID=L7ETR8_STRT8|nr:hypothetical protein STRTUCAR8_00476 [Streptomyces turgidiscabies Car8]
MCDFHLTPPWSGCLPGHGAPATTSPRTPLTASLGHSRSKRRDATPSRRT